jgi:two-component system LytT family response regulator
MVSRPLVRLRAKRDLLHMIPEAEARFLIVDDEALARDRLLRLLAKHALRPHVEVARNGEEAVAAVESFEPQLVFLDIQLPDVTGFDVIEAVGSQHMPSVIFVTAYDAYAIRAFDVQAVDYLVKPYTEERFLQALWRAQEPGHGAAQGAVLQRLLTAVESRERRYLQRLMVRTREGVLLIKVADVEWIEAENNYVRLHLAGRTHLLREKLSSLQARLDPGQFARIHRSAIVNLDRVLRLKPWFSGDYLMLLDTGQELRLSRTYREEVQRQLGGAADLVDAEP